MSSWVANVSNLARWGEAWSSVGGCTASAIYVDLKLSCETCSCYAVTAP